MRDVWRDGNYIFKNIPAHPIAKVRVDVIGIFVSVVLVDQSVDLFNDRVSPGLRSRTGPLASKTSNNPV